MRVLLGPKITIPSYNEEQKELWVDKNCPSYTGIIAAVNNIAYRKYGCFIDELSKRERDICFDEAAKIGIAYVEMPD